MTRPRWMAPVALYFVLATALGASASADEESPATGPGEEPITARDREHWAFRPLHRPPLPRVRDRDGARGPVDLFILARLEAAGLTPMPAADRRTLIRRVTFDLTGLPPSPGEVEAFVADASPDAWERLVDRLLGSAAYGERWGQHWLDLARFAETDGFEQDHTRPGAWRYRDWVIDALNNDLPFDTFARLQIAGDELRPRDPGALVATGFALCGPDMSDINLKEERLHMVLNDITATVGSVFLGLQFGCAQCHNHRSDPVSQADFYRLRAFFENVEYFREQPLGPVPRRQVSEKEPKKKRGAPAVPHGRILRESDSRLEPSFLRVRGDFRQKGLRLEPAFPRIANLRGETVPPPPEAASTSGLRTVLARWLTRPDHPLTTRVVVNRIWQHHFGEGLVRTPSDFGTLGDSPSHPLLLDWLATELPRLDWSLKRLHRLILTSAAYRRASRPSAPGWTASQRAAAARSWKRAVEVDAENRLLARQRRRRLEAECIRDALLAVSGQLVNRTGGPGIMTPLPEEIRKSIRKRHWSVSPDEADHHRRSIYLFVRRNLRYPFLEVFDRPDTNVSCARRNRTTIAPQSLALLNSEHSLRAARHLAGRVLREAGGDADSRVTRAYQLALGRPPAAVECELAAAFLRDLTSRLREEARPAADLPLPLPLPAGADPRAGAALTDLCLSLLNLNEFVYVD